MPISVSLLLLLMSNTSIVTDTAKDATKRSVVDFSASIFQHTTQDWSQHTSVKAYASTPYVSGGVTVAAGSLRATVTYDDGSALGSDINVVLPLNVVGSTALAGSAPIIIQSPTNKVVLPGSLIQFTAAAISDSNMTFQWQLLLNSIWTALPGKTATTLVITDVTEANNGSYRLAVTNVNGTTYSASASLVVTSSAVSSDGSYIEPFPNVHIA